MVLFGRASSGTWHHWTQCVSHTHAHTEGEAARRRSVRNYAWKHKIPAEHFLIQTRIWWWILTRDSTPPPRPPTPSHTHARARTDVTLWCLKSSWNVSLKLLFVSFGPNFFENVFVLFLFFVFFLIFFNKKKKNLIFHLFCSFFLFG